MQPYLNIVQVVAYFTLCTVIKFIRELQQVGGFHRYSVSSTNKTDRHDMAEILLNVALNTITLAHTLYVRYIRKILNH
jgi:hypothetical protein